jgi:hypothetical protein
VLRPYDTRAVELSALRQPELGALMVASNDLDLSQFSYVAVHAPSNVDIDAERQVVRCLLDLAAKGWPIVVHPDAIHDYAPWRALGDLLCVENMEKRKPIGRTVEELASVFEELPDASLCLDLGHARQVDATMTEAYLIAKVYESKIRQVHISEVNTCSGHDRLSFSSIRAEGSSASQSRMDAPRNNCRRLARLRSGPGGRPPRRRALFPRARSNSIGVPQHPFAFHHVALAKAEHSNPAVHP